MPEIPAPQAGLGSRSTLAKVNKSLSLKQNKHKRAGSVAQITECLPSKCEALGSISRHTHTHKGISGFLIKNCAGQENRTIYSNCKNI
jgi:hypothetical protein